MINQFSLSLLQALPLGFPRHFFDMILVDHYILADDVKDSNLFLIHLGIASPLVHSAKSLLNPIELESHLPLS